MATITFLAILVQVFAISFNQCGAITLPKFPAILIFGDSTVDTGNNNYVYTFLKANYLPYGEDFPNHIPTGRFSNGKLIPDLAASILGIKESVPPFLNPNLSPNDIVTGVSFASAGSGYDDLTTVMSNVIPVSKQPDMFRNYTARLEGIVGGEAAKKIINGALVIISAGTNDWTFNFYDIQTRKFKYDVNGYQDFLQNKTHAFIKELYELGLRNMIVAGLPPIGCLPIQITAKFQLWNRKCLDYQNSDAQSYNAKLQNLLPQIEAELPGIKIFYADVFGPLYDMMTNPTKYGFIETKKGCCGTGEIETTFMCNKATPKCQNTSRYLFFDSIHPTQAAYNFLTQSIATQILPKFV